MYQAIPYRSWRPLHNTSHFTPLQFIPHSSTSSSENSNINSSNKGNKEGMVWNMVSENAVIVIGRRGCCMSHVVKRLLLGLGVNPAVYEVEENDEASVVQELEREVHEKVQFPAVFIGGKIFGGLDRLMATHISGDLVPLLKQAGALWL